MTDFLQSVRPVQPRSLTESVRPGEGGEPSVRQLLAEPSVRQLLAELAHLEDVVRAAGYRADDPLVLTAMAREQDIIDELHCRNP
ncbi:MAG: hypothetical protein ABIQ13_02025 [Pedococcus sp.]